MGFIDAYKRNENDPKCVLKEAKNMVSLGLDMLGVIR